MKIRNGNKKIESKLGENKIMVTGKGTNHSIQSGRWPCGCCGSGSKFNFLDRVQQMVSPKMFRTNKCKWGTGFSVSSLQKGRI